MEGTHFSYIQGELTAGPSLRGDVKFFFDKVDDYKSAARENRMRLDRERAERIVHGTEDDAEFHVKYAMAQTDICGHCLIIETSYNPDSLLDALLTHRMYFLCSEVMVATIYLEGFEMDCVETSEKDILYRTLDGRKEFMVCTSYEQTMKLMEESENRGDYLFIPTSAGAA